MLAATTPLPMFLLVAYEIVPLIAVALACTVTLVLERMPPSTWIPEPVLRELGVRVEKKDLEFLMANGQTITRSIGFAFLRAGGFFTVDEVVFGQPGDLALLGARTLEGFGARVDPRLKRLVATAQAKNLIAP